MLAQVNMRADAEAARRVSCHERRSRPAAQLDEVKRLDEYALRRRRGPKQVLLKRLSGIVQAGQAQTL